MNTAQVIASTIGQENAVAVTLEYGYAVTADGRRVLFQPAHIEKLRRNKNGRCTYLEARYDDGSILIFQWSENSGARYSFPRKQEV